MKDQPLVFIHITKTGGTSIKRSIQHTWKGGHVSAQYLWGEGQDGKIMKGILGKLEQNFTQWDSVTVVRNPYDRLVSTYKHFQKHNFKKSVTCSFDIFLKTFLVDKWKEKILSLEKDSSTPKIQLFYENGAVNIDWMFFLPQYYWITYNDKIVIKNILRFENLNNDYTKWTKKFNYRTNPLAKENITDHDHYSTYYSAENRELVEKLYKKDLETFSYTFDKIHT